MITHGLQIAWAQAPGRNVGRHNAQANAIAQNFVDAPSHSPDEVQTNPKFQARLQRNTRLRQLVSAEKDTDFVA